MSLSKRLSRYPLASGEWFKAEQRCFSECDGCKAPIVRGDDIYVIETEVSFMRGDDDVEAFCVKCAADKRQSPPPSKREQRIKNLTTEIELAKQRIETSTGNDDRIRKAQKVIAKCQQSLDVELAKGKS